MAELSRRGSFPWKLSSAVLLTLSAETRWMLRPHFMHFPSASQSMPHATLWKEARTHRVHYHLSSPSVERIRFCCRGSQLALITHSSAMAGWAVFQSALIPAVWKKKQLSAVNVGGEVSAYGIWRRSGYLGVWVASVSSPEFGFQTQTFIVRIPHETCCEEKLPYRSKKA